MAEDSPMFTPVTLGPLALKNRTMLSPTWMGRADSTTGAIFDSNIEHYANVAKGECGLIIVEHTAINEEGLASDNMLRLYDDKYIADHKKLTDAVHSVPGAKVMVQLNSAGCNGCHPNRYGPSRIVGERGIGEGKEMTLEQIHQLPKDFVAAAKRAKAAGYDGVHIHAAHGYLLSSFLSPVTNRRTDEYGGSLENRGRIILEVCKAVREAMGKDFAVSMKINCSDFAGEKGTQPEMAGWVIKQLEGVLDFVEISGGAGFGQWSAIRPGRFHDNPEKEVWYIEELKTIAKMTSMPLAVVGGVRTPSGAKRAFEAGATLVSLSRPLVRHPFLVKYWHEGKAYTPCISCCQCIKYASAGKMVKCWVKYGDGEFNPYADEE